ncbi:hypothetical protein N7448_000105 [Penicillium atrosanguineum]|nr:hypothetical protein N7448_000105 [Penicillium atrosanguineum]
MYDSYCPHLFLAQVPLTVSPFINLPTSVTLPYTYKSVPSTLPPSVTVDPSNPDAKARYVISSSGEHAAHPDEILAACQSLEQHLKKTRSDAEGGHQGVGRVDPTARSSREATRRTWVVG